MILLDSSVWVAYFHSGDYFHGKAKQLILSTFQAKQTIIVPEFIYVEVLNSIWRVTKSDLLVSQCKKVFLQGPPVIQLDLGGSMFWYQAVEKVMKKVNLKASDLIIASSVVYYQVEHFETFDKILLREVTSLL